MRLNVETALAGDENCPLLSQNRHLEEGRVISLEVEHLPEVVRGMVCDFAWSNRVLCYVAQPEHGKAEVHLLSPVGALEFETSGIVAPVTLPNSMPMLRKENQQWVEETLILGLEDVRLFFFYVPKEKPRNGVTSSDEKDASSDEKDDMEVANDASQASGEDHDSEFEEEQEEQSRVSVRPTQSSRGRTMRPSWILRDADFVT